jgi:hypothetical protein
MIVEVTKERIHDPSLHWLRGDLLNATGDRPAAERSYCSRAALQAEILVLRHQFNVPRRKSPKRVAFGNIDRLLFVGLYRFSPK